MWAVVAIIVVMVGTVWFNLVRYRGCSRCPGTYSRREYFREKERGNNKLLKKQMTTIEKNNMGT